MALYGCDMSHWNSWENTANKDFVIIKATEGKTGVDKTLNTRKKLLNNILHGYYHYANSTKNEPYEEAEHFISHIKDDLGNCILALDWEGNNTKHHSQDEAEWAFSWLTTVYLKTGVKPLIYINKSDLSSYGKLLKPMVALDCGLWLADWTATTQTSSYKYYTLPKNCPWTFAAIHQYCGNTLDLDRFNGTVEQFKKYCEVHL